MRMRFLSCFAIAVFCISGIVSCKKNDTPDKPEGPAPEPLKTEKGSPLANPISKMIGPSGGTLTSENGKLNITVPAGTVTTNTNFSIQPITSEIPSAKGDTAYRILPEGTVFSKPITITYHYNAADLKGTSEDLLLGCYQTGEGKWSAVPSALNKSNGTITIQAQHFSDWAIVPILELKIEKPVLTSVENTDIEIVGLVSEDSPEALLAPLVPTYDVFGFIETISDWEVIKGGGIIGSYNETPFQATYSPFSPITHGTIAEVKVDIKGNMAIDDPSIPGNLRKIGKVTLIGQITLVNDVYMVGDFGGVDINAVDAEVLEANGHMFIHGSMSTDTSLYTFVLHVVGAKAGSFPCGSLLNEGNSQVQVGGEINQQPIPYVTEYLDCGPPSHPAYSSGQVVIDNWGPVGTYITGSFSGAVYKQADPQQPCSPPSKGLSITFRALRGI